jgi:SAM-dependent methyltransferase
MVEDLRNNLSRKNTTTEIQIFHNIFADVAARLKSEQLPDSIIYINVLEHIEDDRAELKTVWQTLREKGRVFIFVPALPVLFSEFDRRIGHFRRYRKTEIEEKCRDAQLRIVVSRYFDVTGIVPWLLKYRLMKSTTMESGAVHLYDKLVVPVAKPLERFLPPPIGKNLLIIAEKVD